MPKFRKLPVEIEARQWSGKDSELYSLLAWIKENGQHAFIESGYSVHGPDLLVIKTLEGNMKVLYHDWVIKGVHGEFYPCKPDIFAKTYEPIEEDEHEMNFEHLYDGHYNDHDPLE